MQLNKPNESALIDQHDFHQYKGKYVYQYIYGDFNTFIIKKQLVTELII